MMTFPALHTPIPFWKLTAAGNDFVCIDNRTGRFDSLLADDDARAHFARRVCQRGHGVGADGVIFASPPEIEEVADIAAHFLEADGSDCELCGNGTGCFVRFVVDSGIVPDQETRILTQAGVVLGCLVDDPYVRVCIPSPEGLVLDHELLVEGQPVLYDFAIAGIPHAVVYVDDLEGVNVAQLGFAMRHHEAFQPRGANVNFVKILDVGEIEVRTFEFGVEGETLACGTGSSTAAMLASLRCQWDHTNKPVHVHVRSGKVLRVHFHLSDTQKITDPCLETPVQKLYTGTLSKEFLAGL